MRTERGTLVPSGGAPLSVWLLQLTKLLKMSGSFSFTDGIFSFASLILFSFSKPVESDCRTLLRAFATAITQVEPSARNWWQHPYYIAGLLGVLLLLVLILFLRSKARKYLLKEVERLEKENWFRKVKGGDAEDILKKRMKDVGIDPSAKNIDSFENKVKVGLEIKLAECKRELSECESLNNPRFFERFSMLPYALQKDLLDGIKSKRKQIEDHERELQEGLYQYRDQLPEIHKQLSPVVKAFQEVSKAHDYLIAELSRRMKSDKQRSPATKADVEDVDILKDNLPTLEEKYSCLKDTPRFWKDHVAKLREDDLRRSISTLNEQRKNYFKLAGAPLARKQELLDMLRQAKLVSPNYCIIFQKYLGDYPELIRAAQEFDEAVGEAIAEFQEIIDRPEEVVNPSKEVAEFIERSFPPKNIMTVNDVVVAYEHRYDSIQNLIRGFLEPSAIEEKITAVLTANPDADLVPLESSLGIKVISVQRKGKAKGASAGDLYVGSDE